MKRLIEFGLLACVAASAAAQPITHQKLSVMERAAELSTGQYVWEPEAALTGPLSLEINLTTQRMVVYRGAVPIAASTISSGSEGRETPTGAFSILQKEIAHRSGTYDNASMPYMQRITSKGVAMPAICRATRRLTAASGCPRPLPGCSSASRRSAHRSRSSTRPNSPSTRE